MTAPLKPLLVQERYTYGIYIVGAFYFVQKQKGAGQMKDFIFVMFVGSAVINLTLMMEQREISHWFITLSMMLMVLHFVLHWRDKAHERN